MAKKGKIMEIGRRVGASPARANRNPSATLPTLWPPEPTADSDLVGKIVLERGGLPPKPGQLVRSDELRVREVDWQLERFAEIIEWDSEIAEAIVEDGLPFHRQAMAMRHYTGQYDADNGGELYLVDAWVQWRIDPTVDVRR
jgi:hypothetical protein